MSKVNLPICSPKPYLWPSPFHLTPTPSFQVLRPKLLSYVEFLFLSCLTSHPAANCVYLQNIFRIWRPLPFCTTTTLIQAAKPLLPGLRNSLVFLLQSLPTRVYPFSIPQPDWFLENLKAHITFALLCPPHNYLPCFNSFCLLSPSLTYRIHAVSRTFEEHACLKA